MNQYGSFPAGDSIYQCLAPLTGGCKNIALGVTVLSTLRVPPAPMTFCINLLTKEKEKLLGLHPVLAFALGQFDITGRNNRGYGMLVDQLVY